MAAIRQVDNIEEAMEIIAEKNIHKKNEGTTLPRWLLTGHLSIFRSCAANKTLFHLFTARNVPFLGAHNGHTIFGERRKGKAEIREFKNDAN